MQPTPRNGPKQFYSSSLVTPENSLLLGTDYIEDLNHSKTSFICQQFRQPQEPQGTVKENVNGFNGFVFTPPNVDFPQVFNGKIPEAANDVKQEETEQETLPESVTEFIQHEFFLTSPNLLHFTHPINPTDKPANQPNPVSTKQIKKKGRNKEPIVHSPRTLSAQRPSYSYASIIVQAILSSKGFKITLRDIYNFVQSTYPYYRKAPKNWQNSIRHNLSLNNYFIKLEDYGDGGVSCWTVDPACLEKFVKKKAIGADCLDVFRSGLVKLLDDYKQFKRSHSNGNSNFRFLFMANECKNDGDKVKLDNDKDNKNSNNTSATNNESFLRQYADLSATLIAPPVHQLNRSNDSSDLLFLPAVYSFIGLNCSSSSCSNPESPGLIKEKKINNSSNEPSLDCNWLNYFSNNNITTSSSCDNNDDDSYNDFDFLRRK